MSALTKDELGFVRSRRYGRTSWNEVAQLLDAKNDEEVYVSTVEAGVRTAKPLKSNADINVKPGDTFSVGPRIIKAADPPLDQLTKEIEALKRSGFGSASKPVKKDWGWELQVKGMI